MNIMYGLILRDRIEVELEDMKEHIRFTLQYYVRLQFILLKTGSRND